MRTVYHIQDTTFVTETTGQSLISTGYGDFFCLAQDTSYQGWFEFHGTPWSVHKSIASLTPLDEGEQHTLHHHLYGLRRSYTSGAEDFLIPYQKTLLYQTHQLQGRVLLTCDHRGAYEGSNYGRNYEVIQEDTHVLIRFRYQEQEEWLCLKGARAIEELHNWKEVRYAQDEARKTQSNYWVCDLLTFTPSAQVVISRAPTKAEAITRADVTSYHFQEILAQQQLNAHLVLPAQLKDKKLQFAAVCARWSLEQTLQRFSHEHVLVDGIYAGLPWFFQLWSRDELISLGALMVQSKEQEHYVNILHAIFKRYYTQLSVLREIPNRFPPTTLASVDALGWLAKRLHEFFLLRKKTLFEEFSVDELEAWYEAFLDALHYAKETRGFIFNGATLFTNKSQETWMDTLYHDDGRPGLRIEIQALYSQVYTVLVYLADLLQKPERSILREEHKKFQEVVRRIFVDTTSRGIILDGITPEEEKDVTLRPNIFLAYYIDATLFSKKIWRQAVDAHLKDLYLSWGGIATLPKDHPLFSANYTGQNNKSYHRGDSWYYVNALTAQVLFCLSPEAYQQKIAALLRACGKDILEYGFAAHASELSSAALPNGEASPVQSWSAALFIELVHKLYPVED